MFSGVAMQRRQFLRQIGSAACVLCGSGAAMAGEQSGWGYHGKNGPGYWSDLSKEYAACSTGSEQSPINLINPVPGALGDLVLNWAPAPLFVVNTGHTVQVNVDAGSRMTLAGTDYALTQYHFHHPSEHMVDGRRYPMEVHFVHKAEDGRLAYLAVFLDTEGEAGPASEAISKVWASIPPTSKEKASPDMVDPRTLLPEHRSYYRYAGSQSKPPCAETVLWTIFSEPVVITKAQVKAFEALYPMNARPVQRLNRRYLLSTI